jgi:hypothetical protein
MSYRATDISSLRGQIADLERRIRRLENPGCCPPDPGWVLAEVGGGLAYIFVPSGAVGPIIGTK